MANAPRAARTPPGPTAPETPPTSLHGLTSEEAARRLREHGPNALPPPHRDRLPIRAARHLREPMSLLLLVAATVSGLALGEVIDGVAILVIVVLNVGIALVQEGRATRALEALESLQTPEATVRRDGVTRLIAAVDVVPGDVVILHGGDQVPADVVLEEAAAVEANESVLTGESLPVRKRAGDRAMAGTHVTRGRALGRVQQTGSHTALGRIAAELRVARRAPTPVQRELAALTARLGLAAVVVALGTLAITLARFRGESDAVGQAFLSAVALAVAAVPEGLAAVTSVALALGVRRMAERGAIVRRLPAVETLGSTTVLAIDKTGTVTENRMELTDVVVDGVVFGRDDLSPALWDRVADVCVLCNDAEADPPSGDPMELALLAVTTPTDAARRRAAAPRSGEVPFDEERRRMATFHRVDGGRLTAVKGAPEAVLDSCSRIIGNDGSTRPLTTGDAAQLLEATTTLAKHGRRVLALATRTDPVDVDEVEDELSLLALVGLRDPARPSASHSVRSIRSAGIQPIMMTGDHPDTARAIATEVGLEPPDGPIPTGESLTVDGIPDEPNAHPIYARVEPGQKLELVRRLQAQGHVVGMTGDGVNDAPALRTADIGVALGRSGSDVAREAADLVIVDDDLATIVAAVAEGRAIYDNLRKVVEYLVASNLAEVTAFLVALVIAPELGVPLLPLHLLWINLLTDGLPALALGVDPPARDLMERPPRPPHQHLLDGRRLLRLGGRGMLLAGAALGAMWLARAAVADGADVDPRTVLFSTLVVGQVLYAYAVRLPEHGRPGRNRWLRSAVAGSLVLQVLAVSWGPAQTVLRTEPLTAVWWLVIVLAGAVPTAVFAALHRISVRSHAGS